MLLKTFKGRILAVSLGMTVFSVVIFGYGLASIYYQHMHKCLSRSLTFISNMVVHEYDLSQWNAQRKALILNNSQIKSITNGGLVDQLKMEIYQYEPQSTAQRMVHTVKLEDGRYFVISSSTTKIDQELIRMISSRWFFFLLGFILTSGMIYFLIRLLFAPFNELVNHCLTCDHPDDKPDTVSGGKEIVALRDAIASLQQRISGLQTAQRDTMKALTHELKTPLAQLRLRIDLADIKGEWNSDSITAAREEIDSIADKITEILHATQRVEEMEKVNLKASIEEWIEELKPLWEHRQLQFALDIPDGTSEIELPRAPFERVARILFENALNHSCPASTIYVRCQDGALELENPICDQNTPIIHSTGVGLEIARTLCDYYGWTLSDAQEEKRYVTKLSLIPS